MIVHQIHMVKDRPTVSLNTKQSIMAYNFPHQPLFRFWVHKIVVKIDKVSSAFDGESTKSYQCESLSVCLDY